MDPLAPALSFLEFYLNVCHLAVAWALTIHKSQGMSLDSVSTTLKCFAPGQSYVALSRARNLQALHVDTAENPTGTVFTNPAVLLFEAKSESARVLEANLNAKDAAAVLQAGVP